MQQKIYLGTLFAHKELTLRISKFTIALFVIICIYTKGNDNDFNQKETLPSNVNIISVDSQPTAKAENVAVDNDTLHSEWDDVCAKMMSDPEATIYRNNLETFLFGFKKIEAAQTSLQTTYESVHDSLEKILDSSFASVIPIHELDSNIMSHAEMELSELFRNNHQLRKSILQSLNAHNQSWETKFKNYVSRIVSVEGQSSVIETTTDDKNSTLSTTNNSEQDSEAKNEGCIDDENCADRKSTRLNSSHSIASRMPSSA